MNFLDGPLNEAMKAERNVSEWELISLLEFEEKKNDRNYSFLYFSDVIFPGDRAEASYKFLTLSLGGR
jgi:hypothetical protein